MNINQAGGECSCQRSKWVGRFSGMFGGQWDVSGQLDSNDDGSFNMRLSDSHCPLGLASPNKPR